MYGSLSLVYSGLESLLARVSGRSARRPPEMADHPSNLMADLVADLANVHVGDARHKAAAPAMTTSHAQGMVLSDEDIIEGILFCVAGRHPSTAPNLVRYLHCFSDSILKTLLSARSVCKMWRAASARPLLATRMDKALIDFKLRIDFARTCRCKALSRPIGTGLGLADKRTLAWAIKGWEEGYHSALADDDGLNTAEVAADLIAHLWRNGVRKPFPIFAPVSKRATWERLLSSLEIPTVHVDDRDELKRRVRARFAGALLLPTEAPIEIAKGIEARFLECREEFTCIVFDERHLRSTPLETCSMGYQRMTMARLFKPGATPTYMLLTHQPLPSTVEALFALADFVCKRSNLRGDFDFIAREFLPVVGGETRREELQRWLTEQAAIPTLRQALSQTFYRRRVNRDGKPIILPVKHAEHLMLGSAVHKDARKYWGGDFLASLVDSRVKIHALKSKPQYNGKVGIIRRYDRTTDRYEVLLDEDKKWLRVRPSNVLSVEPDGSYI